MEKETFRASEDMKTFFVKLLQLKSDALDNSTNYEELDEEVCDAWSEVYERLEEIIKEKK